MSGNGQAYWGIKIDKEILQCKELTYAEKILYGYISTFDHFYAGDEHVAMRLGLSRQTVANAMTKLRKKGFLKGRQILPITQAGKGITQAGKGITQAGKGITQNGNIDKSIDKRLDKSSSLHLPMEDRAFDISEAEISAFLADRGFGEVACSATCDRISRMGFRNEHKQPFRSAEALLAFAEALAGKIEEARGQ